MVSAVPASRLSPAIAVVASIAFVALTGGAAPVQATGLPTGANAPTAPAAIQAPGFAAATAPIATGRAVIVVPRKPARAATAVRHRPSPSASPRTLGRELAARRGWTGSQWTCLDRLWTRESGWHVHDENSSSGAYGIPQALPGSKMASAGSDWRTSAATQIRWGLGYIAGRYGSPCGAWQYSQAHNYY
jgi:hypothetical protein